VPLRAGRRREAYLGAARSYAVRRGCVRPPEKSWPWPRHLFGGTLDPVSLCPRWSRSDLVQTGL